MEVRRRAGYYYQINNRYRYTQIRRFKTLWPDRPVLWLVNGVTTNSSGQGNVKYTSQVPTTPLPRPAFNRTPMPSAPARRRALGNFTAYLFIDKDMKDNSMAGGQYVFAEDFDPTSRSLPTAVAHAFRGVEDFYRTRARSRT